MRKNIINYIGIIYIIPQYRQVNMSYKHFFRFIMSKSLDNSTTEIFINYNLVLFFKGGKRYYPVLLPH